MENSEKMKEQIEEMRKDLIEIFDEEYEKRRMITPDFTAEKMTVKGYRKQKEGEWIDLYKGEYANPIYTCSLCKKGTLLKPHINELGNMDMVQALSAFCPNCGASMKGGAE